MEYLSVNHFHSLLKTSSELKGLSLDELKMFVENSIEYMNIKISFDYNIYDDKGLLTRDLLSILDNEYL